MRIISFIPKRYEKGFELLAAQEDAAFNSIQEALYEVSKSSSPEKLAAKVAKLKNLDEDDVEQIFSSVGGLMSFLDDENDIEDLAEDVIELKKGELTKTQKVDVFKNRLLSLLKDKKIFHASKARDLLTETENLFLNCRIVSDIRPVFNINPEEVPEAGMVIHNLHIHYQGKLTGLHQDIYLSIDSDDIQTLIEALYRAEKKDEVLKGLLGKMGMDNLND